MQTTLRFKPRSVTNALIRICWVIIIVMIVGTIVIKLAVKNTYSSVQPILMVEIFWFATSVLLANIAISYHHLKGQDYQLIEINQNQTGIWVTRYSFRSERLYVPFDWLKITRNSDNVRFDWQHALQFDRKNRPKLRSHSRISINSLWLDATQLTNFLKTIEYLQNGAVGAQPQIQESGQPKKTERKAKFRSQIIAMSIVLIIGNAIAFGTTGKKVQHVAGNDSHQKVQLKDNTTYRTRQLQLTVHHSYAAETDEGDPVLIVNMSVQPRNKGASLSADAFKVYRKWSDKAEANDDDYSEARNFIGTKIKVGGEYKPVMNILDGSGWYGYEYSKGVCRPFNIVVKRPKSGSFDFLYRGFYYQYNVPDKDEDTSIVFHVKTKNLEVLK
ncbi:hypothetical protein HC026_11670 [Lactobacillus sp. LC28-10]|uniref:DUF4352 domain-containing protein n=1 Tax=Secundilactobacillus angelensis TaxID=2722706 RepID=A0ABX1L020_9LACO|nr:hypothetical protein [Secundilactobacillus angelensis]MCH5463160.1 hypothetical protein [Secundilactobacillus angelensis]NLR19547.1 hypothetical protein [Secundilactobacillus angelensis]